MVFNFQDIFTSGSDTAATTINWTLAEMMKNQSVLKKAQAELRLILKKRGNIDETLLSALIYLKAIIKEVLSMHPPGPLLLPRVCGQTCKINGYHKPTKSTVIINAWAIGRDQSIGLSQISFILKDLLIILLISKEQILGIFHLVLEGEFVQA